MFSDLKYAWRQLKKSPGFAITAVVTLALGIGATTAIFTMFDQVMLRMLPVERPQELVRLNWHGSFSGSMSAFGGDVGDYYSYPMYKDLRDKNQVFSGMLAAVPTEAGVSWQNQAENERIEVVTGNYFQLLGLKPAAGRLLTSGDETAKDANAVVVLAYDYWRTRFGGSRDVIGQALMINSRPFTIVGVAPENFRTAIGGYRPRVFVPVTMEAIVSPWRAKLHNLDNHQSLWLTVVARLKPGVTTQQAQASMAPLWHSLRAQELTLYPHASASFKERFVDKSTIKVLDNSRGFNPQRLDLGTPLTILLSMAGLLIAMCTLNVATLLLLRSAARVREMSMRYALGAKSSRIVRQLLIEGGLLGLAGVTGGLALSPVLARILVRLMTAAQPGREPYSSAMDPRVLLFSVGLAFVVSVLFSIAPALHFLKPDLAGALRQSTGTASRTSQRFRKAAVGMQIAISVLLLGGAGLFVRTLTNLREQPVGFDTRNLINFGVDPQEAGYGEDRTQQIMKSVMDRMAQVPRVESVAGTTDPELEGNSSFEGYVIQGHPAHEGENNDFETGWVTPRYFETLRLPLLVGREFTEADKKGAPKVAIVNQSFAKKIYGSPSNALGRLIGTEDKPDTTIVGVVGDIRHRDLRKEIGPGAYLPYGQMDHPVGLAVYVRTVGAPELVEPAIRRAIHDQDPSLVVDEMETMTTVVDMSASSERSLAILAAAFAVLAAILAAVGLYGVLAYSTQSRTREIGVRLALGAPRRTLVALVVREMAWIAVAAALIALPCTVALARLFSSQLYGVRTWDPFTLAAALLLTAIMVAAASALPAQRATAVDPMEALRTE